MSDIGSLVQRLVNAGLSISEAGEIIATAFAAGVASSALRKSPGAVRQERWRERLKASQSVTNETPDETSRNVSKRLETSQRDAASLSIEKKEEIKTEKRERAKASQLPPDWRPDEESWLAGVGILGGQQRADYELGKFRDHALEKGRLAKNWNAAWRNWAKRAIEFGGRNGHGTGNTRTSGHDAILAVAARKARELDRNDAMAGADSPAGFAFGNGIDVGGPSGNSNPSGSDQRDHQRDEFDSQRVREGEIIPPDKNAAGIPRGREFV